MLRAYDNWLDEIIYGFFNNMSNNFIQECIAGGKDAVKEQLIDFKAWAEEAYDNNVLKDYLLPVLEWDDEDIDYKAEMVLEELQEQF